MRFVNTTVVLALLASATAIDLSGRHHEDGDDASSMHTGGDDHSHGNSSMSMSVSGSTTSSAISASSAIAAAAAASSSSAAAPLSIQPGTLSGSLAVVAALLV